MISILSLLNPTIFRTPPPPLSYAPSPSRTSTCQSHAPLSSIAKPKIDLFQEMENVRDVYCRNRTVDGFNKVVDAVSAWKLSQRNDAEMRSWRDTHDSGYINELDAWLVEEGYALGVFAAPKAGYDEIGNSYAYAMRSRPQNGGNNASPGVFGTGKKSTDFVDGVLQDANRNDIPIRLISPDATSFPETTAPGTYLVAMFSNSDACHFMCRDESTGLWRHKPGPNSPAIGFFYDHEREKPVAIDNDIFQKLADNPRMMDLPMDFKAYLEIPDAGLQLGAPFMEAKVDNPQESSSRRDKSKPYFSSKRSTATNLNGEVPMPVWSDPMDPTAKTYVCRHWVEFYLRAAQEGRKVSFDTVNTPKKAASILSPDGYLARQRAEHRAIVDDDRFGHFLREQFAYLQAGKTQRGGMFICAANTSTWEGHALAMDMEIKCPAGVGPQYVVRFYDPNFTLTHQRVRVTDLAEFENLSLTDFLTNGKVAQRYLGDKPAAVTVLSNDVPSGSRTTGRGQQDTLISRLYLALSTGVASEIEAIRHELEASPTECGQLYERLTARIFNGASALYFAMQNGHADVVRTWWKLLKEAGLPSNVLSELLAAKKDDGTHALYIAMQRGRVAAVRAWGKLLMKAGLPSNVLSELLAAKRTNGMHALYVAMQLGNADVIKVWGKLLEEAALTGDVLSELLTAKSANGIPALHVAIHNKNWDALRQYCEVIADHVKNMDQPARNALLAVFHSAQNSWHWRSLLEFSKQHPELYSLFNATKARLKAGDASI